MPKTLTFTMTEKQAESIGLIVCESCRMPRNNHFNFPPYLCAHSAHCKGWKADAPTGITMKEHPST